MPCPDMFLKIRRILYMLCRGTCRSALAEENIAAQPRKHGPSLKGHVIGHGSTSVLFKYVVCITMHMNVDGSNEQMWSATSFRNALLWWSDRPLYAKHGCFVTCKRCAVYEETVVQGCLFRPCTKRDAVIPDSWYLVQGTFLPPNQKNPQSPNPWFGGQQMFNLKCWTFCP